METSAAQLCVTVIIPTALQVNLAGEVTDDHSQGSTLTEEAMGPRECIMPVIANTARVPAGAVLVVITVQLERTADSLHHDAGYPCHVLHTVSFHSQYTI